MNLDLYQNLSRAQKLFFVEHYTLLGPVKFAERFNQEFRRRFTPHRCTVIASRLGVSGYTPEGHYSIQQVAYLTGAPHSTIKMWMRKGMFKGVKAGRYWFIPENQIDKIVAWVNPERAPWPTMSTQEASNIIGITRPRICEAARLGHIDCMKIGKDLFVRKSHIEAAARYMKQKGTIKVPWSKLKKMIEDGEI